MTIIAAYRHAGKVSMGGDSGGFYGDQVQLSTEAKIWQVGKTLLGAAGNFRVIEVAKKSGLADPYKLRDYMLEVNSLPAEWGILVATIKGIWEISEELDVFCIKDTYSALGSGSSIALGALYVSKQVGNPDPRAAIQLALNATGAHNITNRPPYKILMV